MKRSQDSLDQLLPVPTGKEMKSESSSNYLNCHELIVWLRENNFPNTTIIAELEKFNCDERKLVTGDEKELMEEFGISGDDLCSVKKFLLGRSPAADIMDEKGEDSGEESDKYYDNDLESYGESSEEDEDLEDEEKTCFNEKVADLIERMRFSCGGRFTTSGSLEKHPGLEIKTGKNCYTPIGLPISKPQADDLLKYFSKAPFGLGEETKYDDNVRKTWQMEPNEIKITNPNWNSSIQKLVQKEVRKGLDVGFDRKIKANLYKLLLYDEGSHFNFHKDTEKERNMFGTLVVQLPSKFVGGNLIVKQDGEQFTYECASDASFSCKYFGFYADCEHCVKPIESGYRLCLIYNLVFCDSKETPKPSLNLFYNEIDSLLTEWNSRPSSPILYYILDHDYTKLGLKFECLKGRDSHIYNQFLSYISSHPKTLSLYLGIFTQTNYKEEVEDGYMQLKDRDIGISKCVDLKNRELAFRFIDRTCIIPRSRKNRCHNSESDNSGPQGNEGATAETTYHTACLVLVPNKDFIRVRCEPIRRLKKLMKRKNQFLTEQFFELIIKQDMLRRGTELVEEIISYNNPSFAALLLKHHELNHELVEQLVTKFGVTILMEMKLTKHNPDLLNYLISLNDKGLLSYYVCHTFPNESKDESIRKLLEVIEEYNLEISPECVTACEDLMNSPTKNKLKLKIATLILKDDKVIESLAGSLVAEGEDLLILLECLKLLTSEKIVLVLKNEFLREVSTSNWMVKLNLIPFLCSIFTLEVPLDLEQTKVSVIISSIDILNSYDSHSEVHRIQWLCFLEIIVDYYEKFSTNYLLKLKEVIMGLRFVWNGNLVLENIQKGFLALSSLKGNEYLKRNETLVSLLKCVNEQRKNSEIKTLLESIEALEAGTNN